MEEMTAESIVDRFIEAAKKNISQYFALCEQHVIDIAKLSAKGVMCNLDLRAHMLARD